LLLLATNFPFVTILESEASLEESCGRRQLTAGGNIIDPSFFYSYHYQLLEEEGAEEGL
jgi:hypothetical protein